MLDVLVFEVFWMEKSMPDEEIVSRAAAKMGSTCLILRYALLADSKQDATAASADSISWLWML